MARPRPFADGVLRVRIGLFAAMVPALLRLKLSVLELILEPRRARRPASPGDPEHVAALVDAVLERGAPLVRRGCLTRGLTLFYFLRRAGVEAELVFGLGRVGDEFAGHCWVVRGGEPFLEKEDPRPLFPETYRIPARRAAERHSRAGPAPVT